MLQTIQRIAIPEGGRDRGFTTGKIKTALQGGGSCLWVPDSAVKTGRLSARENRVYKASEAELFGFSEVVVSVPGYAVSGNRIVRPVGGGGTLEEEELPARIEIAMPPVRTVYQDGETIDTTGMMVRAVMEDGSVWVPPGADPDVNPYSLFISGWSIDPTEADASSITSGRYINGGINAGIYSGTGERFHFSWGEDVYDTGVVFTNGGKLYIDHEKTIIITMYDGHGYLADYQGNVAWIGPPGHGAWLTGRSYSAFQKEYAFENVPISTENPAGHEVDPSKIIEGLQTIEVRWARPGDGKVLTTTFDITVTGEESSQEGGA